MTTADAKRPAVANRAVEAPDYQSLCGLAVVALVLGLLSAAAFATALLLIIPAAAIGAGLLALRKIRTSDGALAGSALARWGVALGIACIVAVFVRNEVRDELMKRQATDVARRWFSLLADEQISEARALLSGDAVGSLVPHGSPDTPPIPAEQAEEISLNRLRSDPLTTYLKGRPGGDGAISVDHLSPPAFDGPRTLIDGNFTIAPRGGGSHRHATIQFVRARGYERDGTPWRINRWELGDEHGAH